MTMWQSADMQRPVMPQNPSLALVCSCRGMMEWVYHSCLLGVKVPHSILLELHAYLRLIQANMITMQKDEEQPPQQQQQEQPQQQQQQQPFPGNVGDGLIVPIIAWSADPSHVRRTDWRRAQRIDWRKGSGLDAHDFGFCMAPTPSKEHKMVRARFAQACDFQTACASPNCPRVHGTFDPEQERYFERLRSDRDTRFVGHVTCRHHIRGRSCPHECTFRHFVPGTIRALSREQLDYFQFPVQSNSTQSPKVSPTGILRRPVAAHATTLSETTLVAAIPSVSAAIPSVSAATPSVSAAIPSVSAATPSVSAAIPSVSAAIPSVSAAIPSVSAAIPSVSAATPRVSAATVQQESNPSSVAKPVAAERKS